MTIKRQPSCDDPTDPELLPVATAMERLTELMQCVPELETVRTTEAANRVLANTISCPMNVPITTNSAMDGFALNRADIPPQGETSLKVVGEAYAGRPFRGKVEAGEAVRIFTGAVMPCGTDTVVIQEHVELAEAAVRIDSQVTAGRNVRHAGEDLAEGDDVLLKGRRLSAADVGLLASLGITRVSVTRRLRVAFFSTGDEVQALDEVGSDGLPDGMVYDSNRHTLRCLLEAMDVEAVDLGIVRDTYEDTVNALQKGAKDADAIVSSGGISAGEADYVTRAFHAVGNVSFWKLAMRPGRPLACGFVDQAAFFGLPGNPVAVMVTFLAFVQPALKLRMGMTDVQPFSVPAQTQSAIRKSAGRTEYQRGVLSLGENGRLSVALTGKQGAGRLSSMSIANCLIVLPDTLDTVGEGDTVSVWPFTGLLP